MPVPRFDGEGRPPARCVSPLLDPTLPPVPPWLTRNVLVLGVASLINDVSSEMVVPLLPLLILSTGAGGLGIGLVEGVADAVSSLLRLYAGAATDRSGRRRGFVLWGYGLSNVVRPLFALVQGPLAILAIRVTDRVGKGLRTAPRDALLAADVAPGHLASAFGFHRAMDHGGALLGAALAWAALSYGLELRTIFLLSAVPAVILGWTLTKGLQEVVRPPSEPPRIALPRGPLRGLFTALAVGALARPTDVFLLLAAAGPDAEPARLPLLWGALHLVRSFSAYFAGRLADRLGRGTLVMWGHATWCVLLVLLGAGLPFSWRAAVFILGGLATGLSEGAERALVARLSPPGQLGATFGFFHMMNAALTLMASVAMGLLWDALPAGWPLLLVAPFSIGAVVLLGPVVRRERSAA